MSDPQPNPYQNSIAETEGTRPATGLAIAALVIGIVAFLSGIAPVWGLLAGGVAVVLAAIALKSGQPKGFALTGLILGSLAALTSLITTIALVSGGFGAANFNPATALPPPTDSTSEQPLSSTAPDPTGAAVSGDEPVDPPASSPEGVAPTKTAAPQASAPPAETISQKNAVRAAESYLRYMSFSRTGLIEQLEFEDYSTADATYGVDKLNVNWNEQAAESAQNYLDYMAFSRSGLIEQLMFEGFTAAEAEYGVTAVGY